jgi:hypothetical protein
MTSFFDAWVFAPGFPHFSIDSVVTVQSGNGYDVNVFVRQKLKGTSEFANSNHLEISFLNSNWQTVTDTIVFSGVTGNKTFHLPFAPVEVMADADEKISDATTDVTKTLNSTGEYEYQQTYSNVKVDQITDSAMVRITHNWVAPDSMSVPQPGLRISDSRYWTVEGIFPADFKAKGKFIYSRAASLDNTLITNSKDSLVILYRPGAGKPWKGTAFTRLGAWSSGTITVDTLQRGQYTFAVWDRLFLDKNENQKPKSSLMNIYPNPAKENVNVEFDVQNRVVLSIYDSLGKQVSKNKFNAGTNHFTWEKQVSSTAIYYFKLTDLKGNLLESRKVVFE